MKRMRLYLIPENTKATQVILEDGLPAMSFRGAQEVDFRKMRKAVFDIDGVENDSADKAGENFNAYCYASYKKHGIIVRIEINHGDINLEEEESPIISIQPHYDSKSKAKAIAIAEEICGVLDFKIFSMTDQRIITAKELRDTLEENELQ